MAYTVPTAADLKARYPAFAAVGEPVVDQALLEASNRVDDSWSEKDYPTAIMLYAAHLLALDGLGTSVEVQLAGFKRVKAGSLELERSDKDGAIGAGSILSTSYGQRYSELLELNFGGQPLVT